MLMLSQQLEGGAESFVISTIVWYNVLFQINKLSKILQNPKVSVEKLRKEIRTVTEFLQEFRDCGFNDREIAERLEVEISWPQVRQKRTTRKFEYEGRAQTQSTAEELFKRQLPPSYRYSPCHIRGEMFFYELCGFLYSTEIMISTEKGGKLDECCHRELMILMQRT